MDLELVEAATDPLRSWKSIRFLYNLVDFFNLMISYTLLYSFL